MDKEAIYHAPSQNCSGWNRTLCDVLKEMRACYDTQHNSSPLMPAFNSLDMIPIIEQYQPDLWVYGHTHECDDQKIGNTRIISNQRGYPRHFDACECAGFDEAGLMVEM